MGMSDAREFLTAAACKMAGGKWKGGHDISGHVFLLILGSAFLWLEILPVVMRYAGLREERLIRAGGGEVVSAEKEVVERRAGDGEEEGKGTSGVSAPVAVTALSWWMLLMTAAYFHTWFEKVWFRPLHLLYGLQTKLTLTSSLAWLLLSQASSSFTSFREPFPA